MGDLSCTNPVGIERVLITGGGGYVGSALVPRLLAEGYRVKVVDLFWYGREVLDDVRDHPNLSLIELDIRNAEGLAKELEGQDAVLHLACISNDPSFDLAPELGTSINRDAFTPLLDASVEADVQRFVYASSSSIYGVQEEPNVREDTNPLPLTDYSRFKLDCEHMLLDHPGARAAARRYDRVRHGLDNNNQPGHLAYTLGC